MADIRDLLIDEGLKGRESFSRYETVDDLAKAHLNLMDLQRNGPPRVPGSDAEESAWEKFWGSVRPEDPTVYGLEDDVAKKVHEAGLHPTQANKLKELLTKPKKENPGEDWKKQAEERYGEKLESVLSTARKAVERFDESIPGLKKTLDETGLGSHPDLIALMGQIGQSMTGDQTPTDAGVGGDANPNMAYQYVLEAIQLQEKPNFQNPRDPEGVKDRARWQELHDKVTSLGYSGFHDPKITQRRT